MCGPADKLFPVDIFATCLQKHSRSCHERNMFSLTVGQSELSISVVTIYSGHGTTQSLFLGVLLLGRKLHIA